MARLQTGIGVLVFALVFSVYLLTASPTVSFVDSGELTAVCASLGIAHPTGYPVYTMIGRLFHLLPLGFNKAFQLNLLSALLASLAVFTLYQLALSLHSRWIEPGRTASGQGGISLPGPVPAATTALLFGFSRTFWSQALVAEVYALHLLFLCAAVFVLCRTTGCPPAGENSGRPARAYVLFAYLCGLAMANPMTIIVVAPACLYLIASREGLRGSLAVLCSLCLPAFLLGISAYLFLPLRSSVQPALDWGDPETLPNLLRHLSGKQYQVWMFSSLDVAARQLGAFGKMLPAQFTPCLLPFAVLGLWRSYRSRRWFFWFSSIVFAADLLYSINYDIHDIESYFLPCFLMTALWIGLGLIQAHAFLVSRFRSSGCFAAGLVLLSPVLPLTVNFSDVDKSNDSMVYDYTQNMLRGIGQGGMIISRQWDFFCSPLYYVQHVEGLRQDVILIEQELLRRSWYYPQLRRQYPGMIEASQGAVEEFLLELDAFEKGRPYHPLTIQKKFIRMIDSFIAKSIDSRPVYITPEVEGAIGSAYVKVPEGLAYRLYRDDQFHPFEKPEHIDRGLHDRIRTDYFHQTVRTFYGTMLVARGAYLSGFGRCGEALDYFREALELDPEDRQARAALTRCEQALHSGVEPAGQN